MCVAALIAFVLARGGGDHTLRAAFDAAVQVVPGQQVRIAGRPVGHVSDVRELDGDAIVDLAIDDGDWPLHRGTSARLRFGSVSGYTGRFVDLTPGPEAAPALAAGAVLSTASTVTPVEFDQMFNTFDAPTRRSLRGVLDGAADTVDGNGAALADGLTRGAPGLDRIAGFFTDLGEQPAALRTLVEAGARTTAELRAQEPALRALLTHAAGTFDEMAGRARAVQESLERMPPALAAGEHTLGRLDTSLVGLHALMDDIGPGARSLADTAPAILRTTSALLDVAPLATSTLRAGRAAAPDIDRLLRTGTAFLPRLGSALHGATPMLACIRPYAPEIAGMAETWTGFDGSDEGGGYGRVDLTQLPPTVAAGSTLDAQQITTNFKDKIFYAMPRPPGLDAGHPWFLPQCGAGPDALNPALDPERRSG
jgi:ABC-type transporter Mla subunit MlaD